MPSQLESFEGERVERCRRLLVEAEEYRGSPDMAQWIEYGDATVALHRTLLDDSGQPRTNLTLGENLQGCLFCVACGLKQLLYTPAMSKELADALTQAFQFLPPEWAAVQLATVFSAGMGDYARLHGAASRMLALLDSSPDAGAELPSQLRAAGCSHTLTAGQLREAAHLACVRSALAHCEAAQAAGKPPPPVVLRGAEEAARQLVAAAAPSNPGYLLLQGQVFIALEDYHRVAPLYRRALDLAITQKAHWWAMEAAGNLGCLLMTGAEAARYSAAEVRGLYDVAEGEGKLAKTWAQVVVRESMREFKDWRALLEEQVAAAAPGQDLLPAMAPGGWGGLFSSTAVDRRCSACSQTALELRKCSACKAVAYCSRECQVKHWREGGHKRECAALAAAAAAAQSRG